MTDKVDSGHVWDMSGIFLGLWDGKDSGIELYTSQWDMSWIIPVSRDSGMGKSGIECGMGVWSDTPDSGICLVGIMGLWDGMENDVVKVWDITGILGKVIVNLDKSVFLMRRHVCTHKLTSSGGLLYYVVDRYSLIDIMPIP